jgi:hypothetical protein
MKSISSRRAFIQNTALVSAAITLPNILTAAKAGGKTIIGKGAHKYEVQHNWAKLPSKYTWQTTHNVAVDKAGLLYVIHEGRADQKDHPSIFVFDAKGKFVRAFGNQFQGGGHGLEARSEGNEEFLYVTGYQHLKNFAKLTLTGEQVWEKRAPMKSKLYPKGEDTNPQKRWGRDAFMPTNFAFHDDGGYYLADGYGAHTIHRYDKQGNWISNFGSHGKGDGQFNLPHGLWIDNRPGRKKSIVVADRANARLQWFTLEGKHLKTMNGFLLPANVDAYKDTLLIPDLKARVTLLDKDDNMIHLGEDAAWRTKVFADKLRTEPGGKSWRDGRFLHPHDACFDANGNIIVAEWVHTGRITRLRKLS